MSRTTLALGSMRNALWRGGRLVVLAAAALTGGAAAHAAPAGVALPRAATVHASTDWIVPFQLRCAKKRIDCHGTASLELDGVAAGVSTFSIPAGARAVVSIRVPKARRQALSAEGTLPGTLTTTSATGTKTRRASVLVRAPAVPAAPLSAAMGRWTPTAYDTCPQSLHDSYAVIGPDGKLYPTWHPPTVVDSATGAPCNFGHEHGTDPRTSDIYGWVVKHFRKKGFATWTGIPFGVVNEALDVYAAQPGNEGTPTRAEDNVGHKIDVANDVQLLSADGRTPLGIECDFLLKLHQGSHSADATRNNVHELIYAAQCSDGTRIISSTLSAFGAPNEFNASCTPKGKVSSSGAPAYPSGGGLRLIPDRRCVDTYVLVPPSQGSSLWALYENWRSQNTLRAADGTPIAFFDPDFAVFNPSRFSDITPEATQGIGRTLDLAWDDGGFPANRYPWTLVTDDEPFPYLDPHSPFNGAQREFYLGQTQVANLGGPRYWYTDAYGTQGQTTPFPGSVRQLIGATDNSALPALERQLFGRGHDHGAYGSGVHAPN